jgi:hypothetical protein
LLEHVRAQNKSAAEYVHRYICNVLKY